LHRLLKKCIVYIVMQEIRKNPPTASQFWRTGGFSLIELLVVISIIGVLSAVLIMNLVGARERSRDSQKIQDLNSLKSALRMYYNDYQAYPSPGATNCTNCLNTAIGSSYLTGVSQVGYSYSAGSDGNSFFIRSGLEVGAGSEDENSQTKCGLTPTPGVYAVCAN
jgi:prepilin-type N-terminal cleavage/methylation domain-containing protein